MTALFAVLAAALAAVSAYAFASGTGAPHLLVGAASAAVARGSRASPARLFAAEGEETVPGRRILLVVAQVDETQHLWLEHRRTGDQKLRDRLVLTYAPLVKYVAGRLGSGLPAHVDEGDLVSYGLLGLIERDRALRPRARHQVRDVRDRADQGLDHRRAARASTGCRAPSARARATSSARSASSSSKLEPRADRRGDRREARHHDRRARGQPHRHLALVDRGARRAVDDLRRRRRPGRAHRHDRGHERARPAGRARRRPSCARRWPRRSRGCPSARSSSSRSTTTRS